MKNPHFLSWEPMFPRLCAPSRLLPLLLPESQEETIRKVLDTPKQRRTLGPTMLFSRKSYRIMPGRSNLGATPQHELTETILTNRNASEQVAVLLGLMPRVRTCSGPCFGCCRRLLPS